MKTKTTKRTRATTASPLRIRSILVPLDFSAPSRKALDYAVKFARQFNAKLTLLHVAEPIATPEFAPAFPRSSDREFLNANRRMESGRVLVQLLHAASPNCTTPRLTCAGLGRSALQKVRGIRSAAA